MKDNIKNELFGALFLGIGSYVAYVLFANINIGDKDIVNNIGFVGRGLYSLVFLLFGVLSYAVPFIFFAYSAIFFLNNKYKLNKIKFMTFISFIILFSSLLIALQLDTNIGFGIMKNVSKEILRLGGNGESGGMIGAAIMMLFYPLFGKNGSMIVILILMTLNLLVFGNKQIKNCLKFLILPFLNKKKIVVCDEEQDEKEAKKIVAAKKDEEIVIKKKKIVNFEIDKDKYKNNEEDDKRNIKEKNDKYEINEESREEIKEEKKKIISKENNNIKENEIKKNDKSENVKNNNNIKNDKEKINAVDNKENEDNKEIEIDDIFQEKEENLEKKKELEIQIRDKVERLEEVLNEYGIEAKVVNFERGPVITRFELGVSRGTRVKKIVALQDDIAMNLEAKSVRIEAPIPGKNAVGIEIPNEITESVYFANILKSKEAKNNKSPLAIILGKNIVGENVLVDLIKMPHLLIAGRTGSGKSVCINTLISTIISRCTPEEVKFIMVDPKMVELMPYNEIPHLLVPVIIEPKQAAVALKWAVNEMENRYRLLSKAGARNIDIYNKIKNVEKLSYIVVIIDELADLMMVAPGSIEESIARIAQKARAIGIHLVVATQRPSTDVITGTIKANLPSRISFAVASQIDSRTILDTPGAEKLLGRGDMLFLESGSPNLIRIQGAFISDEEIFKLTDYLKANAKPEYNNEIIEDSFDEDKDELYKEALDIIKKEGRASISLIQRKLKVGYSRAARIFDQLQESGVVGEDREILTDV